MSYIICHQDIPWRTTFQGRFLFCPASAVVPPSRSMLFLQQSVSVFAASEREMGTAQQQTASIADQIDDLTKTARIRYVKTNYDSVAAPGPHVHATQEYNNKKARTLYKVKAIRNNTSLLAGLGEFYFWCLALCVSRVSLSRNTDCDRARLSKQGCRARKYKKEKRAVLCRLFDERRQKMFSKGQK